MKSKLLSILLFFSIVGFAQGQDWAAFHPQYRYLYGVEARLPAFGTVSVPGQFLVAFGDTSVHGNLNETSWNNNWLGDPIFNDVGEAGSIGIYRVTIPNSGIMTFYQVGTPGEIAIVFGELKARVISKTLDTVLGVADSVARLKWESGSVTSHPLFGDSGDFLLSKSFGLIRFRNLGKFSYSYELPYRRFVPYEYNQLFAATVTLRGIPYLHLGSSELTANDYPMPSVGDELEVMGENSHHYLGGWQCQLTSAFSVSLYHQKCIATQNLADGIVKSTWKTIRAESSQPFTGPVFSTDTGLSTYETSPADAVFLDAEKPIAYGPGFHPTFYGQFESVDGLRLKLIMQLELDMSSYLIVRPTSSSGVLYNTYYNPNAFSGPCSTNAPGNFLLATSIPIYIKSQGNYYGKPIVITDSKPTLERPSLHITPNPATTELYISSPEKLRKISMINTLGKTVKETAPDGEGRIGVAELPAGVYLMRWWGVNGEEGTDRVVKE